MQMTRKWPAVALSFGLVFSLVIAAGCGGEPDVESAGETEAADVESDDAAPSKSQLRDHSGFESVGLYDEESIERQFSEQGIARFEPDEPFRQVGWMLSAGGADQMDYRVRTADGWTGWKPMVMHFSEGRLHNATAVLDEPATALEWRVEETVDFAEIEFSPRVTARIDAITEPDPGVDVEPEWSGDEVETLRQAIPPDSMITTREQWGATDPNRVCNDPASVYRMSIHHTTGPSDGGDPAPRMRQMQDYHMNHRNWCDIGYHFVVGETGEILQGRLHSDRPGAHVGGQNTGNVGIAMIGTFTSSSPPDSQIDGVVDIVRWVHEEHGVDLNRDAVRGHREWPGQATACPGDVGLSHLDDIVDQAADSDSPSGYDVDVDVMVHGLDDFYTQGTSDGVPDAFAGEELTVEIRMTNESVEPIREVALDYQFDQFGLEPTHYRIETDHPAYDQQSWVTNSADPTQTSDNPDPDAIGGAETLEMHAFSPDETKRVVIDAHAADYNIGMDEFAGVRAWVRNIKDVYGVQQQFDEPPGTNQTDQGALLQDSARVDVLSEAEWQFRAGHSGDLEGWVGGGDYAELALNTNHDALAYQVDGQGAYLDSPSWTHVDAEQFDEMVLTLRSHDGQHVSGVYWAGHDEDFNDQRALYFRGDGDSEFHTLVVPMDQHSQWDGQIERLRIAPLVADSPSEDDSGWYDIGMVYFQNGQTTSSATLEVVDDEPVDVVEAPGDITVDEDDGEPGDDADDSGGDDAGSDDIVAAQFGADPDAVEVNEGLGGGCATGGSGGSAPVWLVVALALAAGLMVWRRGSTTQLTA